MFFCIIYVNLICVSLRLCLLCCTSCFCVFVLFLLLHTWLSTELFTKQKLN